MPKQSSQSARKKPVSSKPSARKPAASNNTKAAVRGTGGARGKAATAKKTVQRKEARPAQKPKAAAKPAKVAAARKAMPTKPARAKTAAGGKKAAPAKPAIKAKARAAAAPKPVHNRKPAPQPPKKTSTPHVKAPAAPVAAAAKPEKPAPLVVVPYKAPSEFDGFKVNDHVVYPTHGVGKIIGVEAQEIAGTRLELFVIAFEQEKMTLRVPLGKAKSVGMRILSSKDTVRTALKTLRGRARVKRTMWSRRAQEYEAKINSGDLLLIAEVVRDLHRAEGQPEQSYSERQIYESALERLAREVGAVEELDSGAALERVEVALKKAA